MPLARLGSLVEATAVALAPLDGETLDGGKGVLLVAANGATVRFFTTRACTSDAHVVTRGDVKRIRLQGVARVVKNRTVAPFAATSRTPFPSSSVSPSSGASATAVASTSEPKRASGMCDSLCRMQRRRRQGNKGTRGRERSRT